MKGSHLRRATYRPRLEFAIGLLGLAICGLGIGLVTADVLEKTPAEVQPQEPATTTTALINSSVIEPVTTTTTAVQVPPPPAKNPPLSALKGHKIRKAPATTASETQPTTTTPTALSVEERVLAAARSEVDKPSPLAQDGFWCALWASHIAVEAKVEGFQASNSPARLHTIAKDDGRLTDTPLPGYLVFIDLTGKNNANEYITHVGIVESVDGTTIHTIEGNSDDSGLVKRVTRQIEDGFVIDFAPFEKAS